MCSSKSPNVACEALHHGRASRLGPKRVEDRSGRNLASRLACGPLLSRHLAVSFLHWFITVIRSAVWPVPSVRASSQLSGSRLTSLGLLPLQVASKRRVTTMATATVLTTRSVRLRTARSLAAGAYVETTIWLDRCFDREAYRLRMVPRIQARARSTPVRNVPEPAHSQDVETQIEGSRFSGRLANAQQHFVNAQCAGDLHKGDHRRQDLAALCARQISSVDSCERS